MMEHCAKSSQVRVEFQVRRSLHIRSLWIIDVPVLHKENVNEYIQLIDAIVKACVPDVNENAEFFHLVKTYQVHSHSKSYRKYKNEKCHYHFGKFFTIIQLSLFHNHMIYKNSLNIIFLLNMNMFSSSILIPTLIPESKNF